MIDVADAIRAGVFMLESVELEYALVIGLLGVRFVKDGVEDGLVGLELVLVIDPLDIGVVEGIVELKLILIGPAVVVVTGPLDVRVVEGNVELALLYVIGPLKIAAVEEKLRTKVELLGPRTLDPAAKKLEMVPALVPE